jgi:hypothetical protein
MHDNQRNCYRLGAALQSESQSQSQPKSRAWVQVVLVQRVQELGLQGEMNLSLSLSPSPNLDLGPTGAGVVGGRQQQGWVTPHPSSAWARSGST